MANVGQGAVRLLDSDGDSLDQNGELKVSNASIATLGTSTYSETSTKATIIGAVRNDSLAALANTDNEIAPLQVNASGALYVEAVLSSTDNTVLDDISEKLTTVDEDTNAIKNAVEGTLSISGTVTANLSATDNAVLDNILIDTSAIKTAIQVLDDWDDSNYANVNLNLAGSDAPTGGGGESGALRVTIANDSTGVISIDDNGGAITVDGTVTTNSSVADQVQSGLRLTELQNIHDDTTVMIGAVYADDADWTDGSSKHMLIGGLYQSSMQSITDGDVGPLQVDANGQLKVALSATDNGVLDSIKSAVEIIDNAISSNEMQVDVVASLPAGTNNIGDVDIASIAAGDNNIGNVDIASIAAGDNNIGNVDIASALPAGTNNIGDVDIASIAAGDNNIGNVDIASALPAGDNNIGNVDIASSVALTVDLGANNDVTVTNDTAANLKAETKRALANTVDVSHGISIGSSSTEILDALSDRMGFVVVNDSDETIYIALGVSAVAGRGIRLNANGGYFSTEIWQGTVNGICASGSKMVTITEISP